MNKFTRSQMGKIMAYALSAAMAVTVVPTYMMKPLTVMAAAEIDSTQEVKNGESIKVAVIGDTKTRFALFENSDENQTGDKAVYVFDTVESSETSASIPVPYDVPAGTYFVGALEDEIDDKTAASSSAEYKVKKDAMVKINTAVVATNIQASAEDGAVVYLEDDTDGIKVGSTLQLKTTVLAPSSDATYNSVTYTEVDEKGDAKTTENLSIDGDGLVTLGSGSDKVAFGTYYFKATATVAPKSSSTAAGKPLTSIVKVEIKAATKLDKDSSSIKSNRGNMILEDGNDYATVTTKIVATDDKEPVTEKLTWKIAKDDEATKSSEKDGIVTYRDTDGVYATYEIATGKFTPKKAGTYKIQCIGAVSGVAAKVESDAIIVKEASLSKDAITAKVGAKEGTEVVLTCDTTATYSYAVENTDIATVTQTDANDKKPKVVAVSAGTTKLIATIKYYDNGKEYSVTRTQDIVSTVDAKDLDLSKINEPEKYVDSIISTADSDTKDVIIDAILDGTIDATKLAPETIASLDTEVENIYGAYFKSADDTGYNKVEANGLVLSAVYDGILDEDAPKNPVEVAVVAGSVRNSDKANCVEGSVADFVAEYTIDGKLSQPNTPIALTYTATAAKTFNTDKKYDIYENGVKIATVKPNSDTEISFTTSGFSVFSIVEADADTPVSDDIYDKVDFSAHVQRRIGTDDEADIAATVTDDGLISLGTHGQSRRVEMITLNGLDPDSVEMTAHVQRRVDHPEDVADLTQVVNEDGSISLGTEHQSRRLEAFSMNLKGDLADQYDVYYRVHAQNVGWLGWAKNGELAGTSHKSLRLEEIEIVFVEKGTEFDASQYIAGHEDGDRGYLNSETAFIDGSVK
ncbi:hypothetical protein KQI85_15075 [Falcatimonas sp. MSJ-15]|uniref:hypothetical protein n=1 Tax=Falcatimonas sp. MSJ-15 TaxID=2841515 RepID=UPI001C10492D|nr:hypothetical protein [Falcatimonas sp. MSJ-15]MBU5471662.1 hypothetical protein [Falcatimonas sp. MSJ-15]